MLKKNVVFNYIRMHGFLTDDMQFIRRQNGNPQYNYMYIDALFDFLLSIDIKPFC